MRDARVDAYIEEAAEFARPVLCHFREAMHRACAEVEETIKWSRPFFLYRGQIVANLAAFKAHCSVNLWAPGMKALPTAEDGEGYEALGRMTCLADLPPDAVLMEWLGRAFQMADGKASGEKKRVGVGREGKSENKADLAVPEELAAGLARTPGAVEGFAALSRSCRKEYVEWIEEAKRSETKARRVAEAVVWIVEGKRRNWKYEGRSEPKMPESRGDSLQEDGPLAARK